MFQLYTSHLFISHNFVDFCDFFEGFLWHFFHWNRRDHWNRTTQVLCNRRAENLQQESTEEPHQELWSKRTLNTAASVPHPRGNCVRRREWKPAQDWASSQSQIQTIQQTTSAKPHGWGWRDRKHRNRPSLGSQTSCLLGPGNDPREEIFPISVKKTHHRSSSCNRGGDSDRRLCRSFGSKSGGILLSGRVFFF